MSSRMWASSLGKLTVMFYSRYKNQGLKVTSQLPVIITFLILQVYLSTYLQGA